MIARCSLRASRGAINTNLRLPTSRNNSSASQSARKLPEPQDEAPLKPWMRNFLIGATAGLVVTQGYLYYDQRRARDSFVAYALVKKEPVSSTASLFHLEPKDKTQDSEVYKNVWKEGIWNVHFKQPQIQIVRSYTPLPAAIEPGIDGKLDTLRFLIRRDPHGEVSSYLHRLPIGSEIELRGPNLEYHLSPNAKQVVFIAGGTGIAPALQVAHTMFGSECNRDGDTDGSKQGRTLHILWANRMREDCLGGVSDEPPKVRLPPKPTWSGLLAKSKPKPVVPVSEEKGIIVQELEQLKRKYPGQVTVEYFVNTEDTWIDEDAVMRALSRFDDTTFSTGQTTASEQRQILISGPEGFISHLAGPKEWRNGREEQGGVSKIIAHAISKNPHNVKVWKI